ncbi:hypothetical protein LIER_36576 [Lithospermum erythrorhizon]|uniref:Uncharacterized protein n=1 Tax=Lithospermum erythrorhizon TaxID=34254 RepID=A0AAV3PBP4_LITER
MVHRMLHFTMFFIDARSEISVAESRRDLERSHLQPPRPHEQRGRIKTLLKYSLALLAPEVYLAPWQYAMALLGSGKEQGSELPTLPRSEHFTGSFNR